MNGHICKLGRGTNHSPYPENIPLNQCIREQEMYTLGACQAHNRHPLYVPLTLG